MGLWANNKSSGNQHPITRRTGRLWRAYAGHGFDQFSAADHGVVVVVCAGEEAAVGGGDLGGVEAGVLVAASIGVGVGDADQPGGPSAGGGGLAQRVGEDGFQR